MIIRPLQKNDKHNINQVLKETEVFTLAEIDAAMELIEIYLTDAKQNDYYIYSAVNHSNDVAGFVCFGPTPLTSGTYDLYWIAVKPTFHRQGYGKQLLQFTEDTVKSKGGRLIIVETSSQPKYEKTRNFYKKNNYLDIARIKDYYKIGDDLIIYGKYLSQ